MTSLPDHIRPVARADRDAVLDTVRAANLLPDEGMEQVAVELDGFFDNRDTTGAWLIDVTASAVAGVAYYVRETLTDGTWNLLMLAVHPDQQGRGRGSALVGAVEQDLRSRGARLLVIETSGVPEFAGQRVFYERLGYRQQGCIEEFFEPGDAKVIYAKLLATDPVRSAAPSELRTAGNADLPQLARLASAFYAADGFRTPTDMLAGNLRSLVASHAARVAVVTDPATQALIAFAITTTSFGLENGLIAEVEDLYVDPAFRRRGVGAALIDDADGWARMRGCTELEVVVAPHGGDVEHLHSYYEAAGFVDDGRRLRSRHLHRG